MGIWVWVRDETTFSLVWYRRVWMTTDAPLHWNHAIMNFPFQKREIFIYFVELYLNLVFMQKLPYDLICLFSILLSLFLQEFYGVIWFVTFIIVFSILWFIWKKLFPKNTTNSHLKRGLFFSPKNSQLIIWTSPTLRYVLIGLSILSVGFCIVIFEKFPWIMLIWIALSIWTPVILYDIFWKELLSLWKK